MIVNEIVTTGKDFLPEGGLPKGAQPATVPFGTQISGTALT